MADNISRSELKELFELHQTAMRAQVNAGFDLLSYKMDEVIKKQDCTNGRVNCLEIDLLKIKENPIIKVVRLKPISVIVGIVIALFILVGLIKFGELLNIIK